MVLINDEIWRFDHSKVLCIELRISILWNNELIKGHPHLEYSRFHSRTLHFSVQGTHLNVTLAFMYEICRCPVDIWPCHLPKICGNMNNRIDKQSCNDKDIHLVISFIAWNILFDMLNDFTKRWRKLCYATAFTFL